MVFNRKRKLAYIRRRGSELTIGQINGIMNPTQLWFDSGIRSQGYGRVDWCFSCTIPKDFIKKYEIIIGRKVDNSKDKINCIYNYYFGI